MYGRVRCGFIYVATRDDALALNRRGSARRVRAARDVARLRRDAPFDDAKFASANAPTTGARAAARATRGRSIRRAREDARD